MIITPNQDARRPRATVAALRRRPSRRGDDWDNLEHIGEEATPEMLEAMRLRLTAAEGDASGYYDRNTQAFDYWHARWTGQTTDGRKWPGSDGKQVWPWPGASDTRARTTEMIVNEHLTVCMFALMNMKVQAQSTRPLASMRESQQATKLLNWMLFTHMSEEIYREMPLCLNWRNGFGSALLEVTWEQETRLYFQPINLINLQALAQHNGLGGQNAESGNAEMLNQQGGAGQRIDEFIQALFDPAAEEMAIAIVQSASPIVTKPIARRILKDLREMRTAEIPIPDIIKSKPRWTALRPMVDVLFPASVSDLQRSPWVARVEYVTETELTDRVELAGYDEKFVDQVLDVGPVDGSAASNWRYGANVVGPGGAHPYGNQTEERQYRLEHFYQRGLRDGVPAVYCTVFHQDAEIAAKHEPLEYEHGEYPLSLFRREYHERPILSSRGLAEVVYTWEQEIKKQRDSRSDRTDLAMKPPLLTTYEELLKMKEQFMPETIIPMRRFDDAKWFPAPPFDMGSIEIEKSVMATIDRFFPLFNAGNPALMQQAQQQLADAVLMEVKPVVRQTYQLMQQYLDDETVNAVVGQMQRPFNVGRKEIQGRFHVSATVDMRDLDPDFLKQKLGYITQLAGLDTMGVLDRAKLIRLGAESISYELAEEVVQEAEPATQKEKEDEMLKFDLIVGSGSDQPMPMGGNMQLRMQTLQEKMQAAQNNPATQRIMQQNPEILKVLENRAMFFQRQMQQQQNAQIGRMQVSNTFDKQAATGAA